MDAMAFDAVFDQTIDDGIAALRRHLGFLFGAIRMILQGGFDGLNHGLLALPAYVVIPLVALLAWRLAGWGLALFALVSLLLCLHVGLWELTITTTALVGAATIVALAIAIPIGILAASSRWTDRVVQPSMDLLQTMPPYVYLLPAIALLGFGGASAMAATVIMAIPPAVRLTALGLKEVPVERVELARSLGAGPAQVLLKVKLPSALPTIMAGVNQALMMALGMVVIAGIIGAGGLGGEVYRAIRYLEIDSAFDAGLAVVVVAILLDRISAGAVRRVSARQGYAAGA